MELTCSCTSLTSHLEECYELCQLCSERLDVVVANRARRALRLLRLSFGRIYAPSALITDEVKETYDC